MKTLLIIAICLVSVCNCNFKLPSTWKKCPKKDPKFDQCITTSVEHAIKHLKKPLKKLGVPSLEPLHLKNISTEIGSGDILFHVNFTFLNIHGLTKIHVSKFDFDFDTKTIMMDCSFPELVLELDFVYNGTLQGIPVNGSGFGRVTMDKVRYVVTYLLDEYTKHGGKYFEVVNGEVVSDVEMVKFQLERLFKEDKLLEENVNKYFNDNWEMIMDMGRNSYESILGNAFSSIFNDVFAKFSIKYLFGK